MQIIFTWKNNYMCFWAEENVLTFSFWWIEAMANKLYTQQVAGIIIMHNFTLHLKAKIYIEKKTMMPVFKKNNKNSPDNFNKVTISIAQKNKKNKKPGQQKCICIKNTSKSQNP